MDTGTFEVGETVIGQVIQTGLGVENTDSTAAINFWLAKASGSLGQPSPSSSDWDTFGETFDSVATDILFAQDAYANRTLNVGTSGSTKPVIALNSDFGNDGANPFIGVNASQLGATNGIFMGYSAGTGSLSILSLIHI